MRKQIAERVGSTRTQTAEAQTIRVANHQKSQLDNEVCVTLSKVPYYSIERLKTFEDVGRSLQRLRGRYKIDRSRVVVEVARLRTFGKSGQTSCKAGLECSTL